VRTHPPGPILFMWVVRELSLGGTEYLPRLEALLRRTYRVSGADLAAIARSATKRPFTGTDALIAALVAGLLTLLPALIYLPAYGLGAALADRARRPGGGGAGAGHARAVVLPAGD